MDPKDIRQTLNASLEMKHLKRELVGSFLCVILILAVNYAQMGKLRIPGLILAMLLVLVLFHLLRILRIFRKPEGYILCQTELDHPHGGAGRKRRAVYFTVEIRDSRGNRLSLDTQSFRFYDMLPYINKTVTVAYNEETDTVVLIG